MGWERDFENWSDSFYCGGEPPRERIEAKIGGIYELYDAVWDKVVNVIVCTASNKDDIESLLNDNSNGIWWWRRLKW